jgi:hypothetical protein
MKPFADVQTLVLSALAVDSTRVSPTQISSWIERALLDVYDLAETSPDVWEAFSSLEKMCETTVSTDHSVSHPDPDDLLKIRNRGKIGDIDGREIGRVVNTGTPPRFSDQHARPSLQNPWLELVNGKIIVKPKVFATDAKKVSYYYLAKPSDTTEFSEQLANVVAYGAAVYGARDLGDSSREALNEKAFKQALTTLGVVHAPSA